MPAVAAPELYDPLYHTPQDDLYEIYRRMRDDHPVYYSERRDVWCLTRFDDVQAAARNWETFSNANGVDLDVPAQFFGVGNFLEEDPPRHDVLRKVVRPFFVPKEIAKLEAQIAKRVEHLTAQLAGAGRIDIAQDFAWALPIWAICRLIGVPPADDELVHGLVTKMETRRPGDDAPTESMLSALHELRAYAEDLAEQKRRAPGEDLMSHLVAGEAEGAPRREEIPGMTVLLFAAGSETTASLLGNTLSLLAEHGEAQEALRREPAELIDAVIEESLRMDTPVQYLARQTIASAHVHDVEIPEGADLLLIYGAANRDERHFERAEAFDIGRPSQRHLAFGEGIHFCLGAPLARLEARIALPAFLRAIPSYEIVAPVERFSNHTVRGFMHLPAVIG
jgi:cytochrome P450